MEIKQHIPNFVSGQEPKTDTFETAKDLLNIGWVKSFSDGPFELVPFWRYSESKYASEYLLMAEWINEEEHHWLVVGYMAESVGLPEWEDTRGDPTQTGPKSPTVEEIRRSERVQFDLAMITKKRGYGFLQDEIPPELPAWAIIDGPKLKRQEVIDMLIDSYSGNGFSYIGTGQFGFKGTKEFSLMDDEMLIRKCGECFGFKITIVGG